jgi:hypothetical protein
VRLSKARGRYYLSRVIKFGQLNPQTLVWALRNSPIVPVKNHEWTVTDVEYVERNNRSFLFGNLAKYTRKGQVKVIDEPNKRQVATRARNLLEASAPFVYLPEFSGLAYLHVWNGIQEDVFPRRLKAIVEAAFDGFFVECAIEPVSDYRQFLQRLRSMVRVTGLYARVHPPNPHFGRLWKSLDEYVKKRGAEEVVIRESSDKPQGIRTKLTSLVSEL